MLFFVVKFSKTKGYESLATKADIIVETFDVATYSKREVLRVGVAT